MRPHLYGIDTALLTNHSVVRRFREGDGEKFYELLQANSSYIEDHFPQLLNEVRDRESAEAYARRKLAAWLQQEEFAFVIQETGSGDLIGYIRLFNLDWLLPRAELSYFLHRDFTGRGWMTEALARLLQFAFRQLQLEKIYLHTLIDNYNSQRLARRIGFRREGDLRNEFRNRGGTLSDVMRFGLTREEYGD